MTGLLPVKLKIIKNGGGSMSNQVAKQELCSQSARESGSAENAGKTCILVTSAGLYLH